MCRVKKLQRMKVTGKLTEVNRRVPGINIVVVHADSVAMREVLVVNLKDSYFPLMAVSITKCKYSMPVLFCYRSVSLEGTLNLSK